MKWTLLYFDDQVFNIEAYKEFLSDTFDVIGCSDAIHYQEMLQEYYPHVILLDVHMPLIDGHELYKKISAHPLYNGCPILFISGDSSDETKLKSFEEGGVDFLSRTLSAEEIKVRITNKVKFYLQMSTSLSLGNLNLDLKTMKATIGGRNVDLTLLELRMLCNIIRSHPVTISRHEMINKVWGSDSVKPGTVNTHLTNLKPKIESWDHQIRIREENIIVQKKD